MRDVHSGEGMTIDEMVDELDMVSGKGGFVGELAKAYLLAAIAGEREACAKIATDLPFKDHQMDDGRSNDIAEAIRARTTDAPNS